MNTLLVSEAAAAGLLDLSVKTLQQSRYTGHGAAADLPYHKLGRSVRYSVAEIQRWLAAHVQRPDGRPMPEGPGY